MGPNSKPQAILPCLGNTAETSTSILWIGFLGGAEIRELGFRKLQVRDACFTVKDHCTV